MKPVAFVITFIFLGLYITRPIHDPDIWWHLNVGNWIIAHHDFPKLDLWTVSGEGKTFRAYSWLPEIMYSSAFSLDGEVGLGVLFSLQSIILLLLLGIVLGMIAQNFWVGFLLGAITGLSFIGHLSLRPQSITWGLFALGILGAERMRTGGWKWWWCIVAASAVWANSHLSVVILVVGVVVWLFPHWRKMIAVMGAVLFGSCLTPYMGGEWLTFFEKVGHPASFSAISEFKPATLLSYPAAFFVLLLFVFITVAVQSKKTPPLSLIFFNGVFSILGLSVVKFMPFSNVSLALSIAYLLRERNLAGAFVEGIQRLYHAVDQTVIGKGFIVLLFALCIMQFQRITEAPVNYKSIPDRSVNFILKEGLPRPYLTSFSEGGYLAYRAANNPANPERIVPFDGRTNLISHELWNDFLHSYDALPGYEALIQRFRPQTILWPLRSGFPSVLIASGQFCPVFYEDGMFVVLLKKAEAEKRQMAERCTACGTTPSVKLQEGKA